MIRKSLMLAAFAALSFFVQAATVEVAQAQATNCAVTTAAPTYVNGQLKPLSCDTSGNLRTSGGSSGGDSNVNIDEVGGTAVSNTTPGVLDVNVLSGGGTIEVGADATAAPPTYVEGTPNPLSQDLAGNLRTVNLAPASAEATAAAPTYAEGVAEWLSQDLTGNLRTTAVQSGTWNIGTVSTVTAVTAITNALPAGTNNIGDVDVLTLPALPAGTNNIGDVDVLTLPALANQATLSYSLVAAATTNATNVKASAGVLYELSLYNNSAVIAYLKVYDSASAPTCGSGTPVARYIIPASTSGAGSNVNIALGKSFANGIGFCLTTGIADADATAVAASAYLVNLTYK